MGLPLFPVGQVESFKDASRQDLETAALECLESANTGGGSVSEIGKRSLALQAGILLSNLAILRAVDEQSITIADLTDAVRDLS